MSSSKKAKTSSKSKGPGVDEIEASILASPAAINSVLDLLDMLADGCKTRSQAIAGLCFDCARDL